MKSSGKYDKICITQVKAALQRKIHLLAAGEEGEVCFAHAEINDDAFVCVKCGCRVDQKLPAAQANAQRDDTMVTVIKVFLILGCIAEGWLLIPLAWCIPMTVKIFNCLKTGTPISTGMKVCTLLFVSLVAGICLLCMDDNK